AAAAATTTAATRAIFARARFVHRQRPSAHIFAVQAGNRRLSFLLGAHFDKSESFASAALAILQHFSAYDIAKRGKLRPQFVARRLIIQIPNINLLAHRPW